MEIRQGQWAFMLDVFFRARVVCVATSVAGEYGKCGFRLCFVDIFAGGVLLTTKLSILKCEIFPSCSVYGSFLCVHKTKSSLYSNGDINKNKRLTGLGCFYLHTGY